MCIAIFKPKEVILTKKVLKTCFTNNPHGAGFAYPDKNGVIIEKGFFDFRPFWARFRQVQITKRPMMVHFRVATSGEVDKKNCHPWKIDDNHALIHNGVVQDRIGMESKDCSDTGLFTKHIFRPTFKRGDKVWKTSAYKWLIEESIGKKNKMVIMDKDGNHIIFNEKEGKWEHGAWFSNETFKTARKSIANPKDRWIETTEDGRQHSVTRKGTTLRYTPIKNSLSTKTANSKILAFASKQTGIQLGPPEASIVQEIEEPPISQEVQEVQENTDLNKSLITEKVDVSSMF